MSACAHRFKLYKGCEAFERMRSCTNYRRLFCSPTETGGSKINAEGSVFAPESIFNSSPISWVDLSLYEALQALIIPALNWHFFKKSVDNDGGNCKDCKAQVISNDGS